MTQPPLRIWWLGTDPRPGCFQGNVVLRKSNLTAWCPGAGFMLYLFNFILLCHYLYSKLSLLDLPAPMPPRPMGRVRRKKRYVSSWVWFGRLNMVWLPMAHGFELWVLPSRHQMTPCSSFPHPYGSSILFFNVSNMPLGFFRTRL